MDSFDGPGGYGFAPGADPAEVVAADRAGDVAQPGLMQRELPDQPAIDERDAAESALREGHVDRIRRVAEAASVPGRTITTAVLIDYSDAAFARFSLMDNPSPSFQSSSPFDIRPAKIVEAWDGELKR